MQCLVVDDDRKFSYKLSGYIDSFLKGIFKNYQVLEINEKFDDFSQYHDIDLLFIDIDLKDLNGINIIKDYRWIKWIIQLFMCHQDKNLFFFAYNTTVLFCKKTKLGK